MSGKTWRVSNIVKWVGDDEKLVPIFFEHGEYFIEVFELQFVTYLTVGPLFYILHRIIKLILPKYRNLPTFDQFRITFGAANVTILASTVIPATYYVLKVMFEDNFLLTIDQDYKPIFFFVWIHCTIYIVELCARLVLFDSWMLLIHHVLYYLMVFLAAHYRSIFFMKLDIILDGFVGWEFGLFAALLARRVTDDYSIRMKIEMIGTAIFIASRFGQTFLLGYLLIGSHDVMMNGDSDDKGLYV
ncbi:hypothetical protein AAMO2058_000684600, partial [Amorphochlora amoebiformis]